MKKTLFALGIVSLLAAGVPATAGPTAGGYATDNVEYVTYVPFEVGTATGVNLFNGGKNMVVTSWKDLATYDISDPAAPQLLAKRAFGFKFENEDVSTNGKIMLFSEQLPQNILHIWDIEDPSNPQPIAQLPQGGGHTSSCILDCKFSYSSEGAIVDLRDPANPKLLAGPADENSWMKQTGIADVHDVEEYRTGFLVVSSWKEQAFPILDVRNPLKPKVIARGRHPDTASFGFHSGHWPNKGNDRFILMQGEQNFRPRCSDNQGPFVTYDTTNWKKTRTVKLVDTYKVTNGTYNDGGPPVNALGCSAHWFTEHPSFRNGGLVAIGYYEHGTRFVDVAKNGKIKEVGWFVPWGGSTSAAYWVNKEIVYAVDYSRGIDVLKFDAKK